MVSSSRTRAALCRNDQAMCGELDFLTNRDHSLCGDHDSRAANVQLGEHCLIEHRQILWFEAQRRIPWVLVLR